MKYLHKYKFQVIFYKPCLAALIIILLWINQMNEEDDFNSQAPNTFYDYVSKPLPLHKKSTRIAHSVFDYNTSTVPNRQPEQSMLYQGPQEPLYFIKTNNIIGQIDKQIHQIGQSFIKVFSNPIYEMHTNLKMSADNQEFGSCSMIVSQSSKIKMSISPKSPRKNQLLQFDSRFQSGNLAFVSLSPLESKTYNLFLHKDLNSAPTSTTQWFYFSVKNKNNLGSFTFHIVNYMKPYSAFVCGMKPCVLSKKGKNCWIRGGQNIKYRRNSVLRSGNDEKFYYTLTFTYNFTKKQDEVFFAYSYPYTYTKLLSKLLYFQQKYPNLFLRKILTRTIGGNQIEIITITNPDLTKNKRVLVISARIHPGQTISSFCCEGFIQFVLGNSESAEQIRNQFIIKIIPMLNPDGVVNGSYRASLSGEDLNRKWKNPQKNKHPEIFYAKKSILELPYEKCLYVDFHGHSKKKSSFMYGCRDPLRPNLSRQFPYVLSKKGHHFNYYGCNFNTNHNKQGTSRVTLFKELKIPYCYTMEASFCGALRSQNHFQIKDYLQMGKGLGETIFLYFNKKNFPLAIREIQQIIAGLYKQKDLLKIGEQQSEGSASDSQSQQAEDNLSPKKIQERQKSPDVKISKTSRTNKKWVYLKKHSMMKTYRNQSQQQSFKPRGHNNIKLAVQDLQFQSSDPSLKQSMSVSLRNKHIRYENDGLESFNTTLLQYGNANNVLNMNLTQILLPRMLKNQYKRYQRFKKEQYNLSVCKAYEQSNKQKKQCSFYPHKNKLVSHIRNSSLLQSLKNKKEITGIYQKNRPNLKTFNKNILI